MADFTWLGWSSFKVKASGKTIYFDPVTGDCSEPADLVLISHSHGDHTDLNILSRIRKPETVVITTVENHQAVKGIGLAPGEKHDAGGIIVTAVHAYNIVRMRSPGNPFHPKGFGAGWIVDTGEQRIYHLGDTELIPEMNDIGPIDVMLIPIGGYFLMDLGEAVRTVQLIKPKHVIPMHYGEVDVFFGKELTHLELKVEPYEFAEKVKGITNVTVLTPGETFTI
ncbi:MAG: MBL fold metallo-hydrolase [Bacteroidetes bacterium]|nr:MBL fold metallo-hydrolase [Bacteroidota bacterium]